MMADSRAIDPISVGTESSSLATITIDGDALREGLS
jgi:hypothetical protein